MNCSKCDSVLVANAKFCNQCGEQISLTGVGFLYVMTNPSFKESILKIGQTQHDPKDRASALSTTGIPENFKVEYHALVEDYVAAERKVHQMLSHVRVKENREFFKCTIPEAILTIRSSCNVIKEVTDYKSPEEITRLEKERNEEITRLEKERDEAKKKTKVIQELIAEASIAESRERQRHAEKLKKASRLKNIGLISWVGGFVFVLLWVRISETFAIPAETLGIPIAFIGLCGSFAYFLADDDIEFEPSYSDYENFLITAAKADNETIYAIQIQPDLVKKKEILSEYEQKAKLGEYTDVILY